jgi:hypothetical protein
MFGSRCFRVMYSKHWETIVPEHLAGYRQFVLACHGHLGKGNRRVCLSCVVLKISGQYPFVTGVYMGFRDHWIYWDWGQGLLYLWILGKKFVNLMYCTVYIYICIRVYGYTCIRIYVYMYVYIYIYVCIYIYMYICIYVCTGCPKKKYSGLIRYNF